MKPTFNIGIEEEYQTIDPTTRDLRSHIAAEIIEKGKTLLHEAIKAEMHQSVVEVGTGICDTVQATVAKLYKLHVSNQDFRLYRRDLLMENKWRAARYGIGGKLIDFGKKIEVPFHDLMYEYLEFVDDVVDELGSREEIAYIPRMLAMGSGADRQLRVFRETGDLTKVVDYIVAETALPSHSPTEGSTV